MDWIPLHLAASPPVGTSFCRPIGKPCSPLTSSRRRYCLGTAWSPITRCSSSSCGHASSAQTSNYEAKGIEKELGRKCKLDDLLLSQEDLTKYLRQDANLKTEPSDWEKLFHLKK